MYDTYGNIRAVKHYSDGGFSSLYELHSIGTLTSTETYGYPSTDSSFRDKLTSYNNHTITYDGVGNPLSYYNGSTYTMTWQKGRQLASVTKGGVQTTYTYDSDGIRRSKTVGGSETEYTLAGDKVVGMTYKVGGITYHGSFTYDESGRPYSITMPGPDPVVPATYYYVLNLQGDVIKLVDAGGTAVVNYTYDAWGNIVSIKDEDGDAITSMTHVGRINPFRYRGYVYDEETGFYYLNSRYYDPKIRRFINADGLITDGICLLGFNMYTFCYNNPTNYKDTQGFDAVLIYDFNEASGFGHVGAIIQDSDGKWFFFYWGPDHSLSFLEFVFDVQKCLEFSEFKDEIIPFKDDSNPYKTYDAGLYLEGDFSASAEYVRSGNLDNQNYNLIFNNCSHVTYRVLAVSETPHQEILKQNSRDLIPNRTYRTMEEYYKTLPSKKTNQYTSITRYNFPVQMIK